MKKLLIVLLVLCVVISTVACGTTNSSMQTDLNTDSASDDSSKNNGDENFGINNTAVFKNLKVTATKLEESQGKDYIYAEDGKVFVGVNFEIENISEDTQNISSILLFDAYVDDVKCDYSFMANVIFGDGTLDGEISPGKKLVGWYAVEVPQDWKQLELEVKSDWLSDNKATFVFNK